MNTKQNRATIANGLQKVKRSSTLTPYSKYRRYSSNDVAADLLVCAGIQSSLYFLHFIREFANVWNRFAGIV
ncbi:MAG: hypothetical protein OEL55_06320, partial [Desulfobulbaceae bacterium]|nr:hypothetical protein [Desulfobulbaceae bacterium]